MKLERRLKPSATIDLTPLIDVVFQLVIFFMITTTFKTTPGIELDLPGSATSESVNVSVELAVKAVSDEEIYVNKIRTSLKGVDAAIASELEGLKPEDVEATLEAGAEAPYQMVMSLLDAFRKNGVTNIGLNTKPLPKDKP